VAGVTPQISCTIPGRCPGHSRTTDPIGDLAIDRKSQRINEQIRISPVRVIGHDGGVLGVLETSAALQQAREVGLDLVEVAPQEKPPVCRIMDFGKFKYQQKKRQHKGHTHHSKNKELRLRPKIGEHDLETKLTRAKEFLADKDKVIFSVIFRGRENDHIDEGYKLVDRIVKSLEPVAKLEQNPQMHGRRIVVIFAPK
jgi:translation initiation factor IF-3